MATRQPAAGEAVPRVLSVRAWKDRASVRYHEIREVGAGGITHRLQISIAADSYNSQSVARIDRWDGQAWQPVATIPGVLMATNTIRPNYLVLWDDDANWLSHDDGEDVVRNGNEHGGITLFERDVRELVRLASLVLGIPA